MAKRKSNPNGRVCVDLYEDKKTLDAQAGIAGTTPTNLTRILIRDGLAKLESGEFKVTSPMLATTDSV